MKQWLMAFGLCLLAIPLAVGLFLCLFYLLTLVYTYIGSWAVALIIISASLATLITTE